MNVYRKIKFFCIIPPLFVFCLEGHARNWPENSLEKGNLHIVIGIMPEEIAAVVSSYMTDLQSNPSNKHHAYVIARGDAIKEKLLLERSLKFFIRDDTNYNRHLKTTRDLGYDVISPLYKLTKNLADNFKFVDNTSTLPEKSKTAIYCRKKQKEQDDYDNKELVASVIQLGKESLQTEKNIGEIDDVTVFIQTPEIGFQSNLLFNYTEKVITSILQTFGNKRNIVITSYAAGGGIGDLLSPGDMLLIDNILSFRVYIDYTNYVENIIKFMKDNFLTQEKINEFENRLSELKSSKGANYYKNIELLANDIFTFLIKETLSNNQATLRETIGYSEIVGEKKRYYGELAIYSTDENKSDSKTILLQTEPTYEYNIALEKTRFALLMFGNKYPKNIRDIEDNIHELDKLSHDCLMEIEKLFSFKTIQKINSILQADNQEKSYLLTN